MQQTYLDCAGAFVEYRRRKSVAAPVLWVLSVPKPGLLAYLVSRHVLLPPLPHFVLYRNDIPIVLDQCVQDDVRVTFSHSLQLGHSNVLSLLSAVTVMEGTVVHLSASAEIGIWKMGTRRYACSRG